MNDQDHEISEKLDKIIKLLGVYLIKDEKGDKQVEILFHAGLSRQEISDCTGKQLNTIDQSLYRIKGVKKPNKTRGQKIG